MNLFISSSKKFVIVFLLIYAIGAAGFAAGSELLVRFVVAPQDSYEHYKNNFYATQAPIAAFGDSHVADGPLSTEAFANLGTVGETLDLMLLKAQIYASSGRAKHIVLQYSPEQFAIYRVNKNQKDDAEELLNRERPLLMFMQPHYRQYLLSYWKSVLENPRRILLATASKTPEVESGNNEKTAAASDTQVFANLPQAEQRKAAEIRVQLQAPLPQGAMVERLIGKFSRSLRELRARGIGVCIVEYPLSGAYREAAARVPSFAAMHSRAKQLFDAENIRFVDLTAAIPDRDFADPDHIVTRARAHETALVLNGCFGDSAGSSVR